MSYLLLKSPRNFYVEPGTHLHPSNPIASAVPQALLQRLQVK